MAIVHGEEEPRAKLAERLRTEFGAEALRPRTGFSVDL